MSALDFPQAGYGSGADTLDPSTQWMKQQRQQGIMNDYLLSFKENEEQRQQDAAQRASQLFPEQLKQEQAQTATVQQKALPPLALSDVVSYMMPDKFESSTDPNYQQGNPYRTDFYHAPAEARQHFVDAYAPIAGQLPEFWNQAARQASGDPTIGTGIGNLPADASYQIDSSGNTKIIGAKPATVPAQVRTDAARYGVWKEGMTTEEAQQAMADKQLNEGVIPPHLLPIAAKFSAQITHNPTLANFVKQHDAYNTLKSGYEDPNAGGFGDMAMLEGFQRIVNPGAVVRVQTMNQMQNAMGWLQKIDPAFQWNKATQGDKLTPEARTRLKTLADAAYLKSTAAVGSQMAGLRNLARTYGIPNPKDFVNATLTMAAQDLEPTAQGQEQPQQTSAAPSSHTQVFYTPEAAEQAGKSGKIRNGETILVGGRRAVWNQ